MASIIEQLKYLYYRFIWHTAIYRKYGKLVHIDIELNNNCNQKCIMCWHSQKNLPFKIIQMSINVAYKYLKQARKLGAMSVKFSFRGEPLLYKSGIIINSLELLTSRARELGFVDVMINTNGVFLTKDRIMSLSDAGLTTCIISVDSFEKETYNKIHGRSNDKDFYALMRNLSEISNLLWSARIKTKIKLNFHINEFNKNENFYIPYAERLYNVMEPVFRYTEAREGQDISIKRDRKRKKVCSHAWRRLTVLVDGKIYPCCVCYNEPVDILLGYSFESASYKRKILIDNYKRGFLEDSCLNCSSGDAYE